ncbi:MAG: DEAD/DEAH box helicase family protein [Bacteroidales bacterium]|nr:DEAD/DEAH box helicase family protein [Bacteroidales bacterium]
MVNFKKMLKSSEVDAKINPLDIYESLDRRSDVGPLREAQMDILNEWNSNHRLSKDLVIKLHTGEGKTLIGLLLLQSIINANEGPCVYICPNIYLAQQTKQEADKFGIRYTEIDSDNDIPAEFISGKKILITHVQKVFNGLSIFGIGPKSIQINTVLLDDSHACIDTIRSSNTITIPKSNASYSKIFGLFKDEIQEQGFGSFCEIEAGEFSTFLPIPYWSWNDKQTEVLKILAGARESNEVKFAWPILKDRIDKCQAFISGASIEISPYLTCIDKYGVFSGAKTRILMSATTQDDSFFCRDLGISPEAVVSPLTNKKQKWSGEKLILIPSLIDEALDRPYVLEWACKTNAKRRFGVVSLTSSFKDAEYYKNFGSIIATPKTIFELIGNLKDGKYEQSLVLANRYDGIDLPDNSCRILIIDSLPYFDSLSDKYEESCRSSNNMINIRIAQKIEQGLGRSVRGERDYSVIIIVGPDLIRFVKSPLTSNLFSEQTKKQIEIGLTVASAAKESDSGEPLERIKGVIHQVLNRDEDWKSYYSQTMNEIGVESKKIENYKVLLNENKAENLVIVQRYNEAAEIYQRLADERNGDDLEKGWYLQQCARILYLSDKVKSNEKQTAGYRLNTQLLKPKTGVIYKKIDYVHQNRLENIKKWILHREDFNNLLIEIDGILSNLSFGMAADKFEGALQEIGSCLGFISERPDKIIKKGPDNLWCGVNNQYIMLECKSEVDDDRDQINKSEAGQMSQHCGWFESEYGKEAACRRILIIPTKKLSYHAHFTHDVVIMRRGMLKKFKSSIRNFIMSFKTQSFSDISYEFIEMQLNANHLGIDSIKNEYVESYTITTE